LQGAFIEAVDSESTSDDEGNHEDLLQDMQDIGLRQSMEVPIADQGDEELDMDEGLESGPDLDPDWEGVDQGHQSDCMSSQEHPKSLIN
jgi:hypothetical protein